MNVATAPLNTILLGRWGVKWYAAQVRTVNTVRTWYRWTSGTTVAVQPAPVDYQLLPADYVAPPVTDPVTKLLGPSLPAATVRAMGPIYAQYEDQFAAQLAAHAAEEKLDPGSELDQVTWYYYDRALVLYREAKRTGSTAIMTRAHAAAVMYRNALPNMDPPMYWQFVQGIGLHYLITNDQASKLAIQRLVKNCYDPYYLLAINGVPPPGADATDTRSAARVLEGHVVAHHTGVPLYPNPWEDTRTYAVMAKWTLDEILKSQNAAGDFVHLFWQKSPFMVGLLHEAMILYHRLVDADVRILPAIQKSAEFLWANHWRAAGQGFIYDPGQADPGEPNLVAAPDLNMLIAPSFGWLFKQTGVTTWRDRGDLIMKGGVELAWLDGAKQFNQQYCFGPQYPAQRV